MNAELEPGLTERLVVNSTTQAQTLQSDESNRTKQMEQTVKAIN